MHRDGDIDCEDATNRKSIKSQYWLPELASLSTFYAADDKSEIISHDFALIFLD